MDEQNPIQPEPHWRYAGPVERGQMKQMLKRRWSSTDWLDSRFGDYMRWCDAIDRETLKAQEKQS